MRVKLFYHSFLSDWNNGNARFLRGVAAELSARGHAVEVFEPRDGWSVSHLIAEEGEAPLAAIAGRYPNIAITRYDDDLDLERALDDAELVIVHEWNPPELVRAIGEHRRRHDGYALLFHDTHHRWVSSPDEMEGYDLGDYDGVLAFGRVIRDLYLDRGWAQRAWVWHEAADVRVFLPIDLPKRDDLVWVEDWRGGHELQEFLIAPSVALGLRATAHGVRYPKETRAALARAGIRYNGWAPDREVVRAYARARSTVHVPPPQYATGIPTIRVFEALACGVPLVCAPWRDAEALFRPGDFLIAQSGSEMKQALRALLDDEDYARELAERGLSTLRARHTCRHRVDELLAIAAELGLRPPAEEAIR